MGGAVHVKMKNKTRTWTRMRFSLLRYVFDLRMVGSSDEYLMMVDMMKLRMPITKPQK